MGNVIKLVLAPLIAVGAIVLALTMGIMISDGFGVGGISLPIAILAVGLIVIYSRRKRHAADQDVGRLHANVSESRTSDEYVFEGHGGTVVVHEHLIAIHRHGVGSFLTQGIKGEKRIPFKSITAVQFKAAGRQMAGYIQFSILGGIESRAGIFDATLDENTIMFAFEQNARFAELRDIVEDRCRQTSGAAGPQTGSLADEIEKLAALRDKGVLTAEEFDAQKVRMLRG
jgi:hypothetical protein